LEAKKLRSANILILLLIAATFAGCARNVTRIDRSETMAEAGRKTIDATLKMAGDATKANEAAVTVALAITPKLYLTSSRASPYTYSSENRMLSGPGGATLAYDPVGRLGQTMGTNAGASVTTRFGFDGTETLNLSDASILPSGLAPTLHNHCWSEAPA
jgi:hypothetical protein